MPPNYANNAVKPPPYWFVNLVWRRRPSRRPAKSTRPVTRAEPGSRPSSIQRATPSAPKADGVPSLSPPTEATDAQYARQQTDTSPIREAGPGYLSNRELLESAGIPPVQAQMLLGHLPHLLRMEHHEVNALQNPIGLSDRNAALLIAIVELACRLNSEVPSAPAQIAAPQDIFQYAHPRLHYKTQENLFLILLNTHNAVMEHHTVYRGTVNSSPVRPDEILKMAILADAPSIALAHNHPSGDPTPSPEDIAATRDLRCSAKQMGITLLDHLVIGGGGRFTSLKEKGLGFDA